MMPNFRLSNRSDKRNSGFTFIELILYTALVSIFLTGAVYFAWDIIYGQLRSNTQQEVSENIRIIAQRMQSEIRNAKDIINITPSSLELDSGSLGTTTIFLEGDTIKITQGGFTSTLTTNQIEVTELLFSNRSSQDGNSKNVEFSLSVRYKNPAQRKELTETQTLKTSVELRSN